MFSESQGRRLRTVRFGESSNKKFCFSPTHSSPRKVDSNTPFQTRRVLRNSSSEKSTEGFLKEIFPESSTSGQYFILRQLRNTECCLACNSKSCPARSMRGKRLCSKSLNIYVLTCVYEEVEVPQSPDV